MIILRPVPIVQLACPESTEGFNRPAPFKTLQTRAVQSSTRDSACRLAWLY